MTVVDPAAATSREERFDFAARVAQLACHPTDVLRTRLVEARREQQRWQAEELAVLKVLDDRGAVDRMPDRKEAARTQRTKLEVARSLEDRPALAQAFHDGDVSTDQLAPLCALSTPETDTEWAQRGPSISPGDLQRRVRRGRRPTADDALAQSQARSLVMWNDHVDGMHCGRWRLPTLEGSLVEQVLLQMAERRRPSTGESWDSLEHRLADALHDLVTSYADVERSSRPVIEVVEILDPRQEPGAFVNGEPIAPEVLADVKLRARVRRCVADETGCARTVERRRSALPADVVRHVRRRDTTCRVPGCETTKGLEIHHVDPICDFGDTHLVHRLCAVCPAHHRLLVPHGPWRLVGDADLVGDEEASDGLRLERVDRRARDGPVL
jgi:hypothetical protein